MTSRRSPIAHAIMALLLAFAGAAALAQQALIDGDVHMAEAERAQAWKDSEAARQRAEQLEAEARKVNQAAERTAREAAALAARIQQAEADIAGHRANIRLIGRERVQLQARLAERQQPVMRLTAALQRLSRRPPALALLRPGSVRDTMYMRALLETMLPEVHRRTAALRAEIARGRALERRARLASGELRGSQALLRGRRQQLATIESRQRLASRAASSVADRENDRALALAERARDLGDLVDVLDDAGALRAELARLPGPILRPLRPEESQVMADMALPVAGQGPGRYLMPVSGRLVTGFGEAVAGAPRSRGIAMSTRPGAQVVSPADGRVAFAGPYRGYGNIVIIEHADGWTTLVTGMAQLDARVGASLVAGSPIGMAGPHAPVVTVELRQGGNPVNPLAYIRPL